MGSCRECGDPIPDEDRYYAYCDPELEEEISEDPGDYVPPHERDDYFWEDLDE